ncbi:unnamed protein product [Amoebophrya sp. A120]|nr:unnamed protein product [Amoebophrya sp. A120]|eukprot:GSA120T00012026001.1
MENKFSVSALSTVGNPKVVAANLLLLVEGVDYAGVLPRNVFDYGLHRRFPKQTVYSVHVYAFHSSWYVGHHGLTWDRNNADGKPLVTYNDYRREMEYYRGFVAETSPVWIGEFGFGLDKDYGGVDNSDQFHPWFLYVSSFIAEKRLHYCYWQASPAREGEFKPWQDFNLNFDADESYGLFTKNNRTAEFASTMFKYLSHMLPCDTCDADRAFAVGQSAKYVAENLLQQTQNSDHLWYASRLLPALLQIEQDAGNNIRYSKPDRLDRNTEKSMNRMEYSKFGSLIKLEDGTAEDEKSLPMRGDHGAGDKFLRLQRQDISDGNAVLFRVKPVDGDEDAFPIKSCRHYPRGTQLSSQHDSTTTAKPCFSPQGSGWLLPGLGEAEIEIGRNNAYSRSTSGLTTGLKFDWQQFLVEAVEVPVGLVPVNHDGAGNKTEFDDLWSRAEQLSFPATMVFGVDFRESRPGPHPPPDEDEDSNPTRFRVVSYNVGGSNDDWGLRRAGMPSALFRSSLADPEAEQNGLDLQVLHLQESKAKVVEAREDSGDTTGSGPDTQQMYFWHLAEILGQARRPQNSLMRVQSTTGAAIRWDNDVQSLAILPEWDESGEASSSPRPWGQIAWAGEGVYRQRTRGEACEKPTPNYKDCNYRPMLVQMFRTEDGVLFVCGNVHMDSKSVADGGETNRGAELELAMAGLLDAANKKATTSGTSINPEHFNLVLTGDMNGPPTEEWYRRAQHWGFRDAFANFDGPAGRDTYPAALPNGTTQHNEAAFRRIDFILHKGPNLRPLPDTRHRVGTEELRNKRGPGHFPSDHFELEMQFNVVSNAAVVSEGESPSAGTTSWNKWSTVLIRNSADEFLYARGKPDWNNFSMDGDNRGREVMTYAHDTDATPCALAKWTVVPVGEEEWQDLYQLVTYDPENKLNRLVMCGLREKTPNEKRRVIAAVATPDVEKHKDAGIFCNWQLPVGMDAGGAMRLVIPAQTSGESPTREEAFGLEALVDTDTKRRRPAYTSLPGEIDEADADHKKWRLEVL